MTIHRTLLLSVLVSFSGFAQTPTPVTVTNAADEPVPVTMNQIIRTAPAIPGKHFTIPPQDLTDKPAGSSAMELQLSSTQFAISSVVVTNAGTSAQTVSPCQ